MSPTNTALSRNDDETDDAPRPARLSLSATQVVASALAATTATVAASYLGVAGTVIGAAVASVLTVVGNAVYSHSILRTGERVRDAVPIAARWTPRTPTPAPAPLPRRAARRRGTWQVLAAACVGVFAGVLLVVTGIELIAGRPLTDVVHGTSGSGTSLLGDETQQTRSVPPPTTTVTVTPSVVVVTPTVTVTTSPVTRTATSSITPSDTPTPTPSTSAGSETPTPSATLP
jgi:hypothetical protein